jgi:peptide deformylase
MSRLIIYPNKLLLSEQVPIDLEEIEKDPPFKEFVTFVINEMKSIVKEYNANGIAAPQIGYKLPIIYIDSGIYKQIMINPRIVNSSGSDLRREGCLSFLGAEIEIKRATEVLVNYIDKDFKEQIEIFQDLEARIIQHEIDHLNGITIAQRTSKVYRAKLMRELTKRKRQFKNLVKTNKSSE